MVVFEKEWAVVIEVVVVKMERDYGGVGKGKEL